MPVIECDVSADGRVRLTVLSGELTIFPQGHAHLVKLLRTGDIYYPPTELEWSMT